MKSPMLSDYRGQKIKVICEECDILKTFDGDALFDEHGDANMPGLLGNLCKTLGCTRSKEGFYNRCSLVYYFTHEEWMAKSGMVSREAYEIALGKRLADLQEWEVLHGRCRCGRRGQLNKSSLARRYGPNARLKELESRLLCKECKKYDSVIDISSLPR